MDNKQRISKTGFDLACKIDYDLDGLATLCALNRYEEEGKMLAQASVLIRQAAMLMHKRWQPNNAFRGD